ncbi:unnamed protein product [Sphenostylis stenocarpa]|uniref:Uncharacterized protein n=1 Tax=Sphenostylis stenocarpa TaxID=92480 RepID=A0AA86V7T8_9FABA|nr:unnamed protein product [Sphenostylis stenocarpa]
MLKQMLDMESVKNINIRDSGEMAEEEELLHNKNHPRGGIRTLPFILVVGCCALCTYAANEVCDRFASSGFHANMISYLTLQLNMPMVAASNLLTAFAGTSSLTPLFGALIADSFAGRFWTIIVASIIYELVSYSTLLFLQFNYTAPFASPSMPNTNQLDMTKRGVASRKWNLFNWYYFCMGLASLSALTIVVYIQDNMGWGWGLGIPTIAMLISIIIFVLGSPLYKTVKPHGTPMVRLAQVVVAAVKKRKEALPQDHNLLYKNWELDAAISLEGRLLHSEQFKYIDSASLYICRCLDKAAIVTEEEGRDPNKAPDLWKLATVHRVEELKAIIRMLPIWASGIMLIAASSSHNFVIQQARSMDRHLFHSLQIPPASMSIFNVLTLMVGIVLYERLFVPYIRRFTKNPSGITTLQRMGVGFVVSILATLVSAWVEIKRKKVAAKYHLLDSPSSTIPISVFWLVPQYCLHGVAEVFMVVGHLEFLYDQSPESMRSTAAALYCITTAIGNYAGTIMVSLVHKYSGKDRNWLPDRNLNRGRLECYFYLLSGIQVLNLIYFVICAWFYTYKSVEEISEVKKLEDLEQNTEKISCHIGVISREGAEGN